MRHLILLSAVAGLASAAAAPATLGTEDLRPGTKAWGLSVFRGSEPERFEAEILGVLKKSRSGHDLIIARLSGADLEKTGVIAGMSGSPVYVGDRLIGAVAFSWGFAKEPIAGITPIDDMLSVLRHTPATDRPTGPPSLEPVPDRFRRLRTPVAVSGCPEELLPFVLPELERMGFEPVQAGSAEVSARTQTVDNLRPGSAVAVRLVSGDLNLSGIGTVTWREGDDVLIFGHPMFHAGPVSFPLAEAEIITVMPGYASSFKIGSATRTVGRTVQDRLHAVSGRVGENAATLPVRATVRRGGAERRFAFEVVQDRRWTPLFSAWAVMTALMRDRTSHEPGSVRLRLRLRLDDGTVLEREDLFSDLNTAENINACLSWVGRWLQVLMNNPFRQAVPAELSVEAEHADRVRLAEIADLRLLSPETATPGSTIRLRATLREYQGGLHDLDLNLTLPANLPEGPLTLFLSSAALENAFDLFSAPGLAEVKSWDDLLRRLREEPRNNECLLWGLTREPGLAVRGERFESLPPSRFRVMQELREDSQTVFPSRFRERYRTEFVVYGLRRLTLQIRRNPPRNEPP